MSVEAIEQAITRLSPDDVDLLARWLEEYRADAWDRQIKADALVGRLDAAAERADRDFEAGRCQPR